MVLHERRVQISFMIQSNRSITQITNYINNTIFPSMTNKFNNHFSVFPTRSIDVTQAFIGRINGTTNRYDVTPWLKFSVDVPVGQETTARDRWNDFIIDCRDSLRTLFGQLQGTTPIQWHYHTVDGDTVETDLV